MSINSRKSSKMTVEEASEFFCPCSTPAKLTLDSFPRRAECPGMATPPIRRAGAVPFKWEEAPGRPMQESNRRAPATADADRHLGLPPRLSAPAGTKEERRGTAAVSRAAVVDGPYFLIRRPLSFAFGGKERKGKKVSWDVSSEFKSSATAAEETAGSSASSSSFNSSSVGSVCSCSNGGGGSEEEEEVDEGKEEERMVRVLRYKRKRTLTCVTSHTASQLWASIFGRLKHAAVPCKRDLKV